MIIGIHGIKGSGKDTFAKMFNYLSLPEESTMLDEPFTGNYISSMPDKWEIKKFASKLKYGLEYDYPDEFNVEKWEILGSKYRDVKMPSFGITRRKMIQLRGNKMREINKDYWVNALFNDYVPEIVQVANPDGEDYDKKDYPLWIITDVRFINEASKIRNLNGWLIKIERDTGDKDFDESETALNNWNDWDFILDNNKDFYHLFEQIKNVHKKVMKCFVN